uniref:NADH dehydrogenase [ubiquinone] 1 beta subcomplex subunit 3 n=1 Tax=Panagrellus redivivus TaxID=6233 RepID=A0A7E4UWS8_PANRE
MGGHGHHEPHIPNYTVYNDYKSLPDLARHEKRLERLGLKDPWIRNYAYLFRKPYTVGQWAHLKHLMSWGMKPGIAAAAVLITIEEAYSYAKHGHTSWSGGH